MFVDVEADTFNISPNLLGEVLESIAKGVNNKHEHICRDIKAVKAIIAVDLFGLPADYESINNLAKKYGLVVIEDAAQGFGGSVGGKKSGSLADIGCTSFFPAKPLGCYGDGGAIFTDSDEVAEKLKSIRVHGQGSDKYQNVRLGLTGRLDSIQAAVLLPKLEVFDQEIHARREVAQAYTANLLSLNGIETPFVPNGSSSAWAQYTLKAKNAEHREQIMSRLKKHDVPTAIYYPIPLHQQLVFADLGYKNGDFKVSEKLSSQVFSLPMHPYLDISDNEHICRVIKGI